MALSRIKSIDTLYADVANFDLVIVPDLPLASAINRRLETAHFGPFAITPRRLAHRRRERPEDRQAFLQVIERTDLDWKDASVAIEEVLQCWEHEGRPDRILSYDGFDTPAIREVVGIYDELEITARALSAYRISNEEYPAVAVVEEELLTPLQRSILPPRVESVDLFTDQPFELPEFRVFDSPAAVVDAVVAQLSPERADDVGVVLDRGSEYSTLLESALETAGIPYHGGPAFTDDGDLRTFLACLRAVYAGSDTRIGTIRPILERLGSSVPVTHDEKRVGAVEDPALAWIGAYAEASETVEDALDGFEARLDGELAQFRDELRRLDVLEETLTEAVLDRLLFYLETYEVPVERENEGVLLADATSAAYVDRPLVFCLGLDEGWTHSSPRRPWIDRDREFARQLGDFAITLQSGVDQHYFVVDAVGGRVVSPTSYLTELLDAPFERFTDLPHQRYPRASGAVGDGFSRESVPFESRPEPVETISQSTLKTVVASPRDHLFGRLVDGPERVPLEEGTLFHQFAEFYLSHPSFVEDARGEPDPSKLGTIADVMIEHTRPFLAPSGIETRRTRYLAGLHTIIQFVRTQVHDPVDVVTDLAPAEFDENVFAAHFGVDVDAGIAELWFADEEIGLHGVIDLLAAEDHLVDLKSGSKNSAREVTTAGAIDPPSDAPNFQALVYLSALRNRRPERELTFSFVHVLETADDVITGEPPDVPDCTTQIRYLPMTYAEHVRSRAVFDELCEDASNDCNKTFGKCEYERWRDVLDRVSVPKSLDEDELIASEFNAVLTETMQDAVGPYQYVTKGCEQACRHLAELRTRRYFTDDLDAFEAFVAERIDELNAYCEGEERFPVVGPGGEPNWRHIDHRDMLLEGEITPAARRAGQ